LDGEHLVPVVRGLCLAAYSSDVSGDLLANLTEEQRQLVLSRTTRRIYAKGDVVFIEGEVGDTVHLLQRGTVAVRASTPSGDVVTLAVLGPGASFGEQALIGSITRRAATVTALERCETLALHRAEFADLRSRFPGVDRFLVELLDANVRRVSRHLLETLHLSVEDRTVVRLIELAELYAQCRRAGSTEATEIPIRQEDLATLVGTTRPTVNKVLGQLAVAGVVVVTRGRIEVPDLARLRSLAPRL
jgi:CRP/FNR family cyclic AMP-dependent transcriptional regulator